MGFGACKPNQIALIFLNTGAFFVAGALLGFGIFAFSYMRTTNTALVWLVIAISVCTMFTTAMGAWGALLKKHSVLKVYFYSVLLVDIVLLVLGTSCFIWSSEIDSYVYFSFQTVKDAMPTSECATSNPTTAVAIAACKNTMSDTLQSNLKYMGGSCIAMAMLMVCGLVVAGRMLTWQRLISPLLNGGGLVLAIFAVFCIGACTSMLVGENDKLVKETWAHYMALATSCLVLVLGGIGVYGVRRYHSGILLSYLVLGVLVVVMLGALTYLGYAQRDHITSWTADNFDSSENIRSSLDKCACNNDDYNIACGASDNPVCNEKSSDGKLKHYQCSGSSCTLKAGTATQKYCLSTSRCIDKTVHAVRADLAAIGTMSVFSIVFLLVVLVASHTVRVKLIEDAKNGPEASEPDQGRLEGKI